MFDCLVDIVDGNLVEIVHCFVDMFGNIGDFLLYFSIFGYI